MAAGPPGAFAPLRAWQAKAPGPLIGGRTPPTLSAHTSWPLAVTYCATRQ